MHVCMGVCMYVCMRVHMYVCTLLRPMSYIALHHSVLPLVCSFFDVYRCEPSTRLPSSLRNFIEAMEPFLEPASATLNARGTSQADDQNNKIKNMQVSVKPAPRTPNRQRLKPNVSPPESMPTLPTMVGRRGPAHKAAVTAVAITWPGFEFRRSVG